jgi:NAD+ synthase (glutamine-hydrolysing)
MKNNFLDIFGQPLEGLANENIQSRLRGALLYTRSNMINSMVVNTSNKSELAVGYSTLYGDSVGAISLIGDLYKSEVYDLAQYLNEIHPGIIPSGIIDRAPSAELRENQKDEDSLPAYSRLDAILEGILSYRLSFKDLKEMGFDEGELKKVFNLYAKSEYKRYQFCPIIKIKAKSFGFGYRIPITKDQQFYY